MVLFPLWSKYLPSNLVKQLPHLLSSHFIKLVVYINEYIAAPPQWVVWHSMGTLAHPFPGPMPSPKCCSSQPWAVSWGTPTTEQDLCAFVPRPPPSDLGGVWVSDLSTWFVPSLLALPLLQKTKHPWVSLALVSATQQKDTDWVLPSFLGNGVLLTPSWSSLLCIMWLGWGVWWGHLVLHLYLGRFK